MKEAVKKKILISPLDWGLGHATRCIPIIKILLEEGMQVIIGADGRTLDLLRLEFPDLAFVHMPGYDVQYPEKGSMPWKMLSQLPRVAAASHSEHIQLRTIAKELGISGVISDNRFGLFNKNLPSVYLTHQVQIQAPRNISLIKPMVHQAHGLIMSRFDEVWIPDFEGEPNLSGGLSHGVKLPENARYIGPLSRFKPLETKDKRYDILVIISGPEPQRTKFEWLMIRQMERRNERTIIVRGTPESSGRIEVSQSVTVVDHLPAGELNRIMCESGIIIARAGYSTIMDLAVTGSRAILIPTPGQTEQEYLAEYLKERGLYYSETQAEFDLERALSEAADYNGIRLDANPLQVMRERIRALFCG